MRYSGRVGGRVDPRQVSEVTPGKVVKVFLEFLAEILDVVMVQAQGPHREHGVLPGANATAGNSQYCVGSMMA